MPELSGVLALTDADARLTGELDDDEAGAAVAGAGDVNADGYDDLLIGASGTDHADASTGTAYLLYGGRY